MKYKIPWLPLSALIFYLWVVVLWKMHLILAPSEILTFLENLYTDYGLIGLSIATFLEGIVYLGLYFPGSFVIILAVILSDGTFFSLLAISMTVAVTLMLTSLINYWLGRHVRFKKQEKIYSNLKKNSKKGLLPSCLHPNLLAFYFFNGGIERKSPYQILLVPLIMIPIGLLYAYVIYFLRFILQEHIEKPYIMLVLIGIWFLILFFIENKQKLHQ